MARWLRQSISKTVSPVVPSLQWSLCTLWQGVVCRCHAGASIAPAAGNSPHTYNGPRKEQWGINDLASVGCAGHKCPTLKKLQLIQSAATKVLTRSRKERACFSLIGSLLNPELNLKSFSLHKRPWIMRPHLMPIVSYHCNRALHSQTAGLLLFPRVFKSGPAPPRAFFCPRFLPIKMEFFLTIVTKWYWVVLLFGIFSWLLLGLYLTTWCSEATVVVVWFYKCVTVELNWKLVATSPALSCCKCKTFCRIQWSWQDSRHGTCFFLKTSKDLFYSHLIQKAQTQGIVIQRLRGHRGKAHTSSSQ